jgi:hypothetical protein
MGWCKRVFLDMNRKVRIIDWLASRLCPGLGRSSPSGGGRRKLGHGGGEISGKTRSDYTTSMTDSLFRSGKSSTRFSNATLKRNLDSTSVLKKGEGMKVLLLDHYIFMYMLISVSVAAFLFWYRIRDTCRYFRMWDFERRNVLTQPTSKWHKEEYKSHWQIWACRVSPPCRKFYKIQNMNFWSGLIWLRAEEKPNGILIEIYSNYILLQLSKIYRAFLCISKSYFSLKEVR